MEKQAGTKTRSARRSSTCAAADDDLAARPAVDHNPADLEPPPSTNQRRKQRGKEEEWAVRGGVGGGRGNGTKFETATHYARRLKCWRTA